MDILTTLEKNTEVMRDFIKYAERLEAENKRLKDKAQADQLYIQSLEEENALLRKLECQPSKN